MTYDDEKKQNSIMFFIVSSNFYLNEILLKKNSLKKIFLKIFFRSIASIFLKITKKNEFFRE